MSSSPDIDAAAREPAGDVEGVAIEWPCQTCDGGGIVYRSGKGGVHGGCPAGCQECVARKANRPYVWVDGARVGFRVGVQTFTLQDCEDHDGALWMADMLRRAFDAILNAHALLRAEQEV